MERRLQHGWVSISFHLTQNCNHKTDTNQTQKQGGDADNEDPSRVGLRQYWVGLRLGKIADWRQQFLGPMAELPDTIRGLWQNIIGLWKPK